MNPSANKPPKRLDLQGIRAFAIIVVIGFHFFPHYFPNGYLGVDQFFVLSGFLMCMLLKRADDDKPCSLLSLFYSKRFKRILPLYLLVILVSLTSLYNFFPETAIETNQRSASFALLFVSNRPKTSDEEYFQMLSIATDIFTHTWSLSVEIQFYLLVPVMFTFGSRLSSKFQYVYYGLIGFVSYAFSFASTPTVAFNSVFARIWQFIVGLVVYLATKTKSECQYNRLVNEEEEGVCERLLVEEGTEECSPDGSWRDALNFSQFAAVVSLICLLCITLCPFPLHDLYTRPIVTLITGFLMLVSAENSLLSNPGLAYIGDISYSLYLIHWPIYAYWKLTAGGNQYDLIFSLLISVLLAVLTYETFEKWYLRLSSTSIGVLVVLLFILNVVLINKDEMKEAISRREHNFSRLDGLTNNMTMDDAVELNYRWSRNDIKNLFVPTCAYEGRDTTWQGWCRHTGLSPNGAYKIAIIGNSWTANHATLFYQECGDKARSILQGSVPACEPLYPTNHTESCSKNLTDFEEHIRKEKPDYAFIITRFMSIGDKLEKNVTKFEDDPIYQVMKKQTLKMIANIKHKLFILDAIPRPRYEYVRKIAALLKTHEQPKHIDELLVDLDLYETARKRHAQLVKDCKGKCVLIDYVPEFFNKVTKTFRLFDEKGFSYFTFINHLSPHGLEHVRHVWRELCRKL